MTTDEKYYWGDDYPFIGEIKLFAGTYDPAGWMSCSGQLLSIWENQALFSLIGVTYGGDGVTNFALPDLRGRAPIGRNQTGTGPAYIPGQKGGADSFSLQPVPVKPALTGESVSTVGAAPYGNGKIPTIPPYLNIRYIICLDGIYPSFDKAEMEETA